MKASLLIVGNVKELARGEALGIHVEEVEEFVDCILAKISFEKILYSYRMTSEKVELIGIQYHDPEELIYIKFNKQIWSKIEKL